MSEMDYESGSDGGGGFGFGGAGGASDDDEFESSFDKLGDDGESVADLEEDEDVRLMFATHNLGPASAAAASYKHPRPSDFSGSYSRAA